MLESKDQLAAPRRACPLPPALFTRPGWEAPDDNASSHTQPPAFVRSARGLVDRHPTSAAALAKLSQAELAWDHAVEAVAAARAALQQSQADPDLSVVVSSAVTLIASGEGAEAEKTLSLLDLDGPARVLFATAAADRHDFDLALERLADDESVEATSLRAWVFLCRGQHAAAVRTYREVLRKAGPSPATLTNLGVAHAALGELRRAILVTRQALTMRPSQLGRVGLNLSAYYLWAGDVERALDVLRGLREQRPHDIEPAFAEAGVHLAIRDSQAALRVLRKARTSLWAYASEVQQAELTSNIVFVEWHLGRSSREKAAEIILRELTRIDFASLRIAGMVPTFLRHFSDVDQFRRLLAKLRLRHPEAGLQKFEVHLAMLERRFEDATTLATEWASQTPLDPDAATAATFLLADVRGDYDEAVRIGQETLRRLPAELRLANNVAYALALAGRPKEARHYIVDVDTPQHLATYALVQIASGRVEEGRADYERAAEMATRSGDGELADLVRLNAALALAQFTGERSTDPTAAIGADAEDSPVYALAQMMAARRLHATLDGNLDLR